MMTFRRCTRMCVWLLTEAWKCEIQ